MTLTIGLAIVALCLALAILIGALRQATWTEHLNTASWLALVGVMVGIYTQNLSGMAAALVAASCAALVALPGQMQDGILRRDATLYGVGFAGILSVCGLVYASVPQAKLVAPTQDDVLLIAGQWAALAACGASAMVAIGVSRWRDDSRWHGLGAMFVVAGALGMTYFMGALRADVPTTHFVLPLSTEGGPAMWGLAAKHGGAKALGLHAMLEVTATNPLLWTGAALALVAGLVSWKKPQIKASAILWFVVAGVALAALGTLIQAGFKPVLPDGSKYTTYAQALGADLRIPKNIVSQGGFMTQKSIFVLWSSILGDLGLLMFAAMISLIEGVLSLGRGKEKAAAGDASKPSAALRIAPDHRGGVAALYARDFGLRAAMLIWLSWFLGALASWKMHSTYGFASSSEWTSLGACVLISGLAWLGFTRKARWAWVLPSAMMLALLWVLILSLGFGVPPQSALRL